MKKLLKAVISGLLLSAAMSSASAAVVVGSITKTYGTGQNTASTLSGGSCDTLNANSITVRDSSGCQRFYDKFDFSSINYAALDHLALTLSFGSTNNINNVVTIFGTFQFPEDWKVRFADTTTHGSSTLQDMNSIAGPGSQTFNLLPSQADVYANIAANKALYLWFADEAPGASNFELYSARLDVFGTAAVPEPTSIALFGIAIGALGMSRRRKMR